jgi:hypothetical protein
MWRHKGTDIAHDEQLARPGAGQQVGQQARVRAADEQDGRVLAVAHQVLELLLRAGKGVVVKAPQAQQQVVWQRIGHSAGVSLSPGRYCTSGESLASSATATRLAWPARMVQVLAQGCRPGLLL